MNCSEGSAALLRMRWESGIDLARPAPRLPPQPEPNHRRCLVPLHADPAYSHSSSPRPELSGALTVGLRVSGSLRRG